MSNYKEGQTIMKHITPAPTGTRVEKHPWYTTWIALLFAVLIPLAGLVYILTSLTGCTDDEQPLPTCTELGAGSDQPLFCNAKHYCTYDGMKCTLETPDAGVSK